MPEQMQRVTFAFSEDTYRDLKVRAAVEGTTMTAIVRRVIDDYLAGLDANGALLRSSGDRLQSGHA